METDKHVAIITGYLRTFSRELSQTPGREQDAETVARLLAEFEGKATPTGEALGRSLTILGLRDGIAEMKGADDTLKAIDRALADKAS